MNLQCVKKFDMGGRVGYTHACNVRLKDKDGMLFVYSAGVGVDPGEELLRFKGIEPVHLIMFDMDGNKLWDKELPDGVLPGVWFVPAIAFDMDGDGVDEIYFINNTGAPFSFMHRKLQRLDAMTGEVTGSWPWSWNTFHERLSLCYRYYLVAGYAHGEPVLVTCQGTYGNMYLQGWNKDMEKRWDIVIKADDPGPRASHVTPVIDINNDGVDELFWGERLLSLDDGHEIVDLAPNYDGHSDLIAPFLGSASDDDWYIFTCREGGEVPGQQRVYTFRPDGEVVWSAVDTGHMHTAWLANTRQGKIAMAMKEVFVPDDFGFNHEVTDVFYFNAFTGEPVDFKLPYPGYRVFPLDLNGDGYHEFFVVDEAAKGEILDCEGKKIGHIHGDKINFDGAIRFGKMMDMPGEHVMVANGNFIEIWADLDAVDGEVMQRRYQRPYLNFMQKLMASGYNSVGSQISCGV